MLVCVCAGQPIVPGERCVLEIHKQRNSLGLRIVGGVETHLVSWDGLPVILLWVWRIVAHFAFTHHPLPLSLFTSLSPYTFPYSISLLTLLLSLLYLPLPPLSPSLNLSSLLPSPSSSVILLPPSPYTSPHPFPLPLLPHVLPRSPSLFLL